MNPAPESGPLVYVQEDEWLTTVGEPIDLSRTSRMMVAEADRICAEALRGWGAQAFPEPEIEVCRGGQSVLQRLQERPVDFLVLGLSFDDLDGIDVLTANARDGLARRVFVVSSRKDEHTLQALRTARFDGFFDPSEEGAAVLVPALQQVAGGHGYISPALCRRIIERRAAGVLTQRLTPAELLTFCLVGDGTDDATAAELLGLSDATVQSHRRNLMRKLEVSSSIKLVREAVRLGVVRIQPDGRILRPGFAALFADWKAKKNVRSTAD